MSEQVKYLRQHAGRVGYRTRPRVLKAATALEDAEVRIEELLDHKSGHELLVVKLRAAWESVGKPDDQGEAEAPPGYAVSNSRTYFDAADTPDRLVKALVVARTARQMAEHRQQRLEACIRAIYTCAEGQAVRLAVEAMAQVEQVDLTDPNDTTCNQCGQRT